jgi:uncharacterized protein with HEPN domain
LSEKQPHKFLKSSELVTRKCRGVTVADLRNRLIHGYDAVDFDILWAIIERDLPPLIRHLETIIEHEA